MTSQKCREDDVFMTKGLSCDEIFKGECQQWLPTYTLHRQSNLWMRCNNCYTGTTIHTETLVIKPILNRNLRRK